MLETTVGQRAAQALYRSEGYTEAGRGKAGPFELILFEKHIRERSPLGREARSR